MSITVQQLTFLTHPEYLSTVICLLLFIYLLVMQHVQPQSKYAYTKTKITKILQSATQTTMNVHYMQTWSRRHV